MPCDFDIVELFEMNFTNLLVTEETTIRIAKPI